MAFIALSVAVCLLAAVVLMVFHELVKVLVYWCCKPKSFAGRTSPLKIWRYIDPIGLILSVVCSVTISKPYFFRIREKKTNLLLGIAGLGFLLVVFGGSIFILKDVYGGYEGLKAVALMPLHKRLSSMFFEYLAILSIGMFMANLFPVSTFDMGLIIAGCSSQLYLNIIKADGIIKMIFILTLLLNVIGYAGLRVIELLL